MSSDLVVITPKSIEEAERMSKTLSASRLLPADLHQKPQDVLAIVLTGAELGLAPMQAIRGISIIKGKPTLAAETMGALVRRRSDVCEYLTLKFSDATRATYETKRRGDPTPTTMAFTIQDAQRAGLNGDNWRKYPAAMLRARCLSAICKAVYSDLVLGLYDPEELESVGAPVTAQPTERDVTPTTRPPTNAAEAKAQLAAKLAEKSAASQVVEAAPAKPKMRIIDQNEAWERIKAAGLAAQMSPDAITSEALRIGGKAKRADLTSEDADKFCAWVEDALDSVPPPSDDYAPPVEESEPF